jgi:hypothetical protein
MSIAKSQATTISASTSETTIVTADPNFANQLIGLVITSTDAAASTLTLRDGTAGTTRAIFDYPNAASAPGAPLSVTFPQPLNQAANANWTLQASVNAGAYHVMAIYQTA